MVLREQIAKTFHGLTRGRIGVVFLFIAFQTLFGWGVAVAFARGLDAGEMAVAVVRVFVAITIWLVPPLLAGLATYNRAPGAAWVRIALAACVIAVTTWFAKLASTVVDGPVFDAFFDRSAVLLSIWGAEAWLVTFITGLLVYVARADDLARAFDTEELRRLASERALAEARLQTTQAQIEPHFLFNTLANVRWLYRTDPAAGRSMLRQFSLMLAAALPQMRETRSTLGKELALAVAYLSVQKIRMGGRLEYETQVSPELRDAELPPMMLSTLVENAIKHGLAPVAQGGAVRIGAERRGDTLRVHVTDSGRGLREGSGAGVGLANIEARLAALYGADGALDLKPSDSGGVVATIELPLRILPPSEVQDGRLVA